jgi:hypothetical protein
MLTNQPPCHVVDGSQAKMMAKARDDKLLKGPETLKLHVHCFSAHFCILASSRRFLIRRSFVAFGPITLVILDIAACDVAAI